MLEVSDTMLLFTRYYSPAEVGRGRRDLLAPFLVGMQSTGGDQGHGTSPSAVGPWRSGDRDGVVQVDVLDGMDQGGSLLSGALEGLAPHD